MPEQITRYNVLLSCPTDIIDEIDVVHEAIENFNNFIGDANNIGIKIIHWSTHSYPESGGKPQELLNEQIVRNCDAAIAIFWTRFGTPTDNYGSGTEEEIEELIQMGKQVFVYFSDRSLNPSEFNPDELERVNEFKNKYKDRGIYWCYKDIEEFKRLLTNHVSMHFMKKLSSDENETQEDSTSLMIRSLNIDKIVDNLYLSNRQYLESRYLSESKEKISDFFMDITSMSVPERAVLVPDEKEGKLNSIANQLSHLNLSDSFGTNSQYEEVSPLVIEILSKFYTENIDEELDEDFFKLGNLKTSLSMLGGGPFGTSPSKTLSGTEEEKNKYHAITELHEKILEYYDAIEYFGYLDSLYWFSGVISNVGTRFDEDVDISIYIEQDCLVKPSDVMIPGDYFIDKIIGSFNYFFVPQKTSRISEYADYPERPVIPNPNIPIGLMGKSYEEELEELRDDFHEKIENTFVYEVFEEDEYDVIKFNVSYIKHSSSINFPSFLLFKQKPKKLIYKIVSKHSNRILEGEIKG